MASVLDQVQRDPSDGRTFDQTGSRDAKSKRLTLDANG
jgi:hypothetical protein